MAVCATCAFAYKLSTGYYRCEKYDQEVSGSKEACYYYKSK